MQPVEPITPPASRVWRIVHYPPVLLVLGFLSLAAGLVCLSLLAKLAGIHAARNSQAGAWLSIAYAAVVVGIYLLFVRDVERRRPVELALPGAARELGAGLLTGLLLFSAVVGVIAIGGGYHLLGLDPQFAPVPVLLVGFVPGFAEEVIARGLIFRLLERWAGSWIALAASAALFGAGHLGNAHASPFAALAIALEAGVMLGAAFMLTRRLWGAIGLHAAWNMAQGGLWGIPVSGGAMHGVFAERSSGPDLLTGGAFGAEASLPALIVATAFGVLLLALCVRRGRVVPVPWRRARAG